MKEIFINLCNSVLYILFIFTLKMKNQNLNTKIAKKFVELNNKMVLKKIKKINNDKLLILLPHCIQLYDCQYKVTSNIENCRQCGRCVIHNFVDIRKKYTIEIKIATGGTLARKYIREVKPALVLAVACKRDLITGIRDANPFPVYGVFNIIKEEPCVNTTVSIDGISNLLETIKF
ncbi:MAG: DUF116 domain-containing protein [Fusobacterium sp.]|nr:DUF116 domain-containing protein [Fusobacterium sp.]